MIEGHYKCHQSIKPSGMLENAKITFKKESRRDLLTLLGKSVDSLGFVTDEKNQRVLTIDGEEIHETEFGGVRVGSEIFIKADLPSLMDLSKV
jgi:hypothetical protein